MDEATLRARTQELLRRMGPLTAREIAARLSGGADAAAVPPPRELHRLLLDDPDPELDPSDPGAFHPFPLADGRLVDLDDLVDGTVFTHVLTDDERAAGEVVATPDLAPLLLCSHDSLELPLHGHDTPARYLRDGRLAGPDGWLPDAPVLVARLRDGAVELAGADAAPEPDPTLADHLAAVWDVLADRPYPADDVELVVEALARHPHMFDAARAPLGDLLAAAGIGVDGGRLVPLDEDGLPIADPDPVEMAADLRDHLVHDHGLDDDAVAAVFGVLDHLDVLGERVAERLTGDETELISALDGVDVDTATDDLGVLLGSVDGTGALAEDVAGQDPITAALLLALLNAVGSRLRGTHVRSNGHLLRARLLEYLGDDHAEAERELRRAVELDDNPEAVFELVRFLADRGQPSAALGMLRRVEGPGVKAWTEALEPWARPGPVSAGRNDPCPCGSGRKHKVCCARHNGWPLQARVPLVWEKIVRFMLLPVSADVVEDVTAAAGRPPGPESLDDVAITNLLLFEGGVLEDLCDLRGSLLPADELAMLRDWADVRAGLCEVVEVEPGRGVTVLDLTSGDRIELRDRSLSRGVQVGEAGLTWIVPEPDGPAPAGGMVRVADHRRAPLLDLLDTDPAAEELAAWYAGLSAPPAVANTEGDPLVFTTLRWKVDDPGAVHAALVGRLGTPEEDDDGATFMVLSDDEQWLRGSLALHGDTVTGSANSAARAAVLRDLVAEVAPDARLVDEERLPATDLPFGPDGRGDDEDGEDGLIDLDALSPEERADIEAQLDEVITAHEDAWVDTPLPVLDGATPREAVDDPTRRPALERLLEEVREHASHWDSPGRPMDADRLADLLGL